MGSSLETACWIHILVCFAGTTPVAAIQSLDLEPLWEAARAYTDTWSPNQLHVGFGDDPWASAILLIYSGMPKCSYAQRRRDPLEGYRHHFRKVIWVGEAPCVAAFGEGADIERAAVLPAECPCFGRRRAAAPIRGAFQQHCIAALLQNNPDAAGVLYMHADAVVRCRLSLTRVVLFFFAHSVL